MNFLHRLSISQKISLIPIIGSISFIIYLAMSTLSANSNVMILSIAKDVQFPVVQLSKTVAVDIVRVSELLNSAVTTGDEDSITTADEIADEILSSIRKFGAIDKQFLSTQKKLETQFNNYYKQAHILSLGMVEETIDFEQLPEMGRSMNQAYEKVLKTVSDFNNNQVKEFEQGILEANDSAQTIVNIGYLMGLITITLLFGAAIPIIREIKHSLTNVIDSLNDLAKGEGDLTVRLNSNNQDEIGDLVEAFNLFIEKLQGTIKQVVEIALPLSDMANSVSSNAEETTEITQKQQAGTQSTKAAVDELSMSVQSVADNAALAAEAAIQTSNVSTSGANVVKETVNTINQLAKTVEDSSTVIDHLDNDANQVGVILDVIKGIAEQTNLLALNAAIEAARAGEQGRGFAVVADEVRTLASRTQDSTVEIQSNIEKLQIAARKAVSAMNNGKELAEQSVNQVSKAGNSLTEITSSVEQINQMTGDIAHSTEAQSTATSQIVSHVDEISASTTKTNTASQELATVSSELASLAHDLEIIAKSFKV